MLEEAFLQAIAEHPDDDHYRLVYADWLEDQGDPRAKLVRISRGVPRCKALISDIHGNLEALEAVLRDIASWNVREIYCLGDMVGYGPNSRECVDLIRGRCKVSLLGNFDQALMIHPEAFPPNVERALFWTRDHFTRSSEDAAIREERWSFLANLTRTHREGELVFVHGTPRNPLHEYVFPEDIYNERKLQRIFESMNGYCMHGHAHVAGILTEDRQWTDPAEVSYIHHLDQRKALVNVGSVGQPRDGDWRACYVLLVGRTVHYRRVEYDIEATIRKIYAIPQLENFLGDRLRDGR